MNSELAPLVIFTYRRLDKTIKCLETISNAFLSEDTDIYIFSDGAKGDKDAAPVASVREYLDELKENGRLKKIQIIKRDKNYGLANNVISGVSEVIEKYGRVIVIEDDLIVSPDFLSYMNEALVYYENEEDIWSVTAYTDYLKAFDKYSHDIYYGYRGCSYGWGTWRNRWDTVDWEVKDYKRLLCDRRLQRQFNRGGNDMTGMLTDQMQGKIDSWAIRWCFSQSMQDRYTVYPVKSKVLNTGKDGSGTNQGVSLSTGAEYFDERCNHIKLELLKPDIRINKEFKRKHSDTLGKKIRRNIMRFGFVY